MLGKEMREFTDKVVTSKSTVVKLKVHAYIKLNHVQTDHNTFTMGSQQIVNKAWTSNQCVLRKSYAIRDTGEIALWNDAYCKRQVQVVLDFAWLSNVIPPHLGSICTFTRSYLTLLCVISKLLILYLCVDVFLVAGKCLANVRYEYQISFSVLYYRIVPGCNV